MSSDQTQSTPKPSESTPAPSESHPQPKDSHSSDYAPYPKLDPDDVAPPPPPLNLAQQHINSPPATEERAPISGDAATTMPKESNPYVSPAPASAPGSSAKSE